MRQTVKILICSLALTACVSTSTGCVSTSYEKNNINDVVGGDSGTLILNYENRVREYDAPVIDSHMRIYLEIEKPYIITVPQLKDMDKIYSIAGIEGTVVFRTEIGDKGEVLSSRKILSGGLGLDELAADIIKNVKVERAYLAGKPGKSVADIKIQFRADGAK